MKAKWVRLPPRSRAKCREMVLDYKRKDILIVRCPKRATWRYGKVPYSPRCDGHKEFIEKIVAEGIKAVTNLLRSR